MELLGLLFWVAVLIALIYATHRIVILNRTKKSVRALAKSIKKNGHTFSTSMMAGLGHISYLVKSTDYDLNFQVSKSTMIRNGMIYTAYETESLPINCNNTEAKLIYGAVESVVSKASENEEQESDKHFLKRIKEAEERSGAN